MYYYNMDRVSATVLKILLHISGNIHYCPKLGFLIITLRVISTWKIEL